MKKIGWLIVILWVITGFSAFLRCQQTRQQEHKHQHKKHEDAQQNERERDRWMWQLPQRVMNIIGVRPGMVIGDVGAGEGYFTFRLAKRVGKEGKIYANDIDNRALNLVEKRIRDEGIKNITLIKGNPDDPFLPKNTLDMVIMVNVIHQIDKPVKFLQNLKSGLTPEATLVIVQWDAVKMQIEHPDMSADDMELFSKEYVLKRVKAAGYKVIRIETFLPVQDIYICRSAE